MLALDTNCFIYAFDTDSGDKRGAFVTEQVLQPMIRAERESVTPTLTVAELLTRPFALGLPDRARELRAALEAMPNLRIVELDVAVATAAAEVRAATGLRLPDAIQVATAKTAGAEAVLTNDRTLAVAAAIVEVLLLDDLL